MSPYPTSQMHAAQKRGMYPMGHHHQMPPTQSMGPNQMYQQHNQQNYGPLPSPMHQNYIRPGGGGAGGAGNPMSNSYGRVPVAMIPPQQRSVAPQYNMNQGAAMTSNQSQYYNHPVPNANIANMNQAGYQNVQG